MRTLFKLICSSSLILVTSLSAQVVIGGEVGSAGTDTNSVLLDFPVGQNQGIILPYVRTLPANQAGTIVLDATNPADARVKFNDGSSWIDLSGDGSIITELNDPFNTQTIIENVLAIQPDETEVPDEKGKVVIGNPDTTAEGVLVLESDTKAMVLPKVADVQDIINPSPGMMVYINKEGAKRLAIFNGSRWSYWMP